MTNLKNIDHISRLPLLLGIGIFVYLALRTVMVAMTDDECITMQYHVYENWGNLLTDGLENQGWAGNNHVLNSIFMKLELMVFGKKDWALRLHILLAFVVCYCYTSKTIAQVSPSPIQQFCYLAVLFLNPFLLDFFGLARGYALSMAGGSMAFYYFSKYYETPTLPLLRNVVIGLFIAIWANYSAFYSAFLIGLLILYVFYQYRKSDFVLKHFGYLVLGYLAILLVNALPLYRTIVANNAYGGKTGIFHDMVVGSIECYIHHNILINRFAKYNETWTNIEVYGVIGLSVWALVQVFSLMVKTEKREARNIQFISLFMTLGIAVLVKILFVFSGTVYPTWRTNLLFSFPFFISAFAAFDILSTRFKAVKLLNFILVPFCFWHFYQCANLDNTREWWQAGDGKKVISYMKALIDTQKPQKMWVLGGESYQYFPLSFYAEPELNNVLTVKMTDLSKEEPFDFLFVPTFRQKDVWAGYEPVISFKHGVLYKRKP